MSSRAGGNERFAVLGAEHEVDQNSRKGLDMATSRIPAFQAGVGVWGAFLPRAVPGAERSSPSG